MSRLSQSPRLGGFGLRARLTVLATGLVALVSLVLLWLGWMLAGNVMQAVPRLPDGEVVQVDGYDVTSDQLAAALASHARTEVLRDGGVAVGLVVIAAALLAWTLTGRLLRPLHEVTATARTLSASSLGERIRLDGPRDEVAELADTFDAMLDRLQATFDSQQRFVANASHELRTPLSVIRTELDVTLSDPQANAAELRRMAEVVRGASDRSEQLVEALLLLARTDGTGIAVREPVDMAVLVASAWRAVQDMAAERELEVAFDTPPASTVGDPSLLERVAGNLLENAIRHNVDQGWIRVRLVSDEHWTELRVASSGPPIAAEEVTALFEPFRRAGVARTARGGAGLGLSIVRAIVQAHGGEVSGRPVEGGGLEVFARLPAAP